MASSRMLFFFCCIVLHLVALTVAQPLNQFCIPKQGNFTKNSAYKANLNRLLASFPLKTKNHGFYSASYGPKGSRVNAMAICRGDVKPENCRSCINKSTIELQKLCPSQKEAIIWYDQCMLRYSNRQLIGKMEFGPWLFWGYSQKYVSKANAKAFNLALRTLLNNLKAKAASGGPLLKFATGSNKSPKIYALVQCTPDLSKKQCTECLTNATALLPQCCDRREGGKVVAPSCNFRYEAAPFYT